MDIYEDFTPEDAEAYARARPEYPPTLFDLLRERCHGRDLAWDCATGNGQAAVRLTPWFRSVVATDSSRNQLAMRREGANLQYALAPAERSPLADDSADLVTVAQALHWFDLPAFFAQARRVLKPGGLLAAWCFFLPEVNTPVDVAVRRLYDEILDGYMPPQVGLVIDRYESISPPFGEVVRTKVEMVERWGLDRFARYLGTWAGVGLCRSATGREPIREVMPELARGWGGPEAERDVRWAISVLEARK